MNAAALRGLGVLVTRPQQQSDELVNAIRAAGGSAVHVPILDIVPRPADALREDFEAQVPPDIAVFVSANAVRHGLAAFAQSDARIAAIGPATARAIEAAGRHADIVPGDGADSEHLLAAPELAEVEGRTITIVRGQSGRELLAETLRSRGADVQYLEVYRREALTIDAAEAERLERLWRDGAIGAAVIMSVATLDALLAALPPACRRFLAGTPLVAPGERVIQTALERLPGVYCIQASGPTPDAIVEALAASPPTDPDRTT